MDERHEHRIDFSSHKRLMKPAVILITLLIVIYFVNFFTPLRLTNDTVRYLTIKESIENHISVDDYLPYGYVFFLFFLSKLHLLHSITVPILQFLYLLGALFFVKKLFPKTNSLFFIAIMLLQWTTMKYVITFLSEMQFMFFSTGTIYFFQRYREKRTMSSLLFMLLFLIVSILTRTVGIVLIPALLLSMLLPASLSWKEAIYRYRWIITVFILFGVAAFFFQNTLRVSDYFELFLRRDPLHVVKNNFINHLADWAAVFLNLSYSKIPLASAHVVTMIYFVIGLLFFILVVFLFMKSKKLIPTPVKLYLVFYSIIIFFWPYFDPRFWVPIVPFLIAILMQAVKLISPRMRIVVSAYFICYTMAGLASIGYYTYTSLNKHALSEKQDASIWQNEYEQYFFGRPITHPDAKVREKIIRILEKYD